MTVSSREDSHSDKSLGPSIFTKCGLFVLLLNVSVFAFVWLSLLQLPVAVEQSIDCVYAPPNVSLADMHEEIRTLILYDFKPDTAGAILMNGGFVTTRYDTDVEKVFRQESNFLYVTGYDQPNGTFVLDIQTRKSFLFVPERPRDYAVWNGVIESPEQISEKYKIDEVYYDYELNNILNQLQNGNPAYKIFVMNKDVQFPGDQNYRVDTNTLAPIVFSRREEKTDMELELIRYTAAVSSGAHEIIMNYTRVGLYEYNVEGRFLDGCFACGLTIQAYIPICASGNNSAILHYNANDAQLENNTIILVDAGAEYHGYATDITRTFPVNGRFNPIQTQVYEMTLNVQYKVINILKPGLTWSNLQGSAVEFTCEELINYNYLNATVSECVNLRLYYYFFPHGVSHYIGLDVHDESGPASATLNERNVITVEPGIYFNQALLGPVLTDPTLGKYFVAAKIQPLLQIEFGGVRIEDVVIIWGSGPEVITFPPKSVYGIEMQMST